MFVTSQTSATAMAPFERFHLGPPSGSAKCGRVTRKARGPGRPVDLDEAVTLSEAAMSDYTPMRVASIAELEVGWAFMLHTPRYLETRSWRDMTIGDGLTFVDRKTGDVYSSGGYNTGNTVLGLVSALADGTGPAQVPIDEQLRPAIDLYYFRVLRGANEESDQTARDRLWLHVLDAQRLRRLVLASPLSDDLWQNTRAAQQALQEFPLIGPHAPQIHAAFDAFERAVDAAVGSLLSVPTDGITL